MNEPLVEVQEVSLIYHELHGETLAIDDLSFRIYPGEFVSIVGPSGCGKTSLLSLLAGIITPSSGSIRINPPEHTNKKALTGYMLQTDSLLDWRTVEGNIMLGLEIKGIKNAATTEFALELLNRYGLTEFKDHYPNQLSGGMRQKVALIRTLAFSPELLLLDEPFSALDFQTRLKVSDEVYRIIRSEGKTAILVTHDISEAIAMSERVIVFTKRPAGVKNEYTINLNDATSPLSKRNMPGFNDYFKSIWRELDDEEEA